MPITFPFTLAAIIGFFDFSGGLPLWITLICLFNVLLPLETFSHMGHFAIPSWTCLMWSLRPVLDPSLWLHIWQLYDPPFTRDLYIAIKPTPTSWHCFWFLLKMAKFWAKLCKHFSNVRKTFPNFSRSRQKSEKIDNQKFFYRDGLFQRVASKRIWIQKFVCNKGIFLCP